MPRAAERALEVVEGNGHIGDAKAADMAAPPPGPQTEEAAELDRIYRKVTLAILPLFVVTTALSMIDRNNLSYAAISLMPALGLKPTAYGLGSSLFYVTYILFIVPAALLVPHVGARRMLAVMLVAWGAVATCMAFVRSEGAFYALRLLLGLCESGAIPVQWAHIMAFFPKTRVVRPFSYLYIGIALSGILGAPLATGLLALDGRAGLRGYQWLFVVEGIPAVLLAILMWFLLPDRPEDIRSLSPGQLATLKTDLAAEMAAAKERRATPSWQLVLRVLRGRYAPLIAVIHVIAGFVSSIFIYWSPVIIMSLLQGSALTPQAAAGSSAKGSLPAVGLSTVPAVVAAVSCVATAAHAQRSKELFMHASLPLLGAGVVTSFFPLLTRAHPAAGFVALVLTLALALAANPSISSILALLYKGPAEVVALPLFDAVLTAGAVIGAPLSGLIVQRSSSGFTWVTVMMGLLICTSSALLGVLAVWVAHGEQAEDLMLRPRRRFRLVSQSGSGGGGDGGGAAESVPKAAAAAATAV